MAYSPEAMARARAAGLRNFTNGYYGQFRPAPPAEEPSEDLRRSSVLRIPSAALHAEPPPPRPKLRGDAIIQARDISAGAGVTNWRPVAFLDRQGWLDRIILAYGATTNIDGSLLGTLHLTQNARPTDADADPVTQAGHIPLTTRYTGGYTGNMQFPNAPGGSAAFELVFDRELTDIANAIYFRWQSLATIGIHTVGVTTIFRESPMPQPLVLRVSGIGALGRSGGTAPLPRPRGPAVPRLVRVKVDMGALGGTYRDVPFRDLAPELKSLALDPATGEWRGTRTLEAIW